MGQAHASVKCWSNGCSCSDIFSLLRSNRNEACPLHTSKHHTSNPLVQRHPTMAAQGSVGSNMVPLVIHSCWAVRGRRLKGSAASQEFISNVIIALAARTPQGHEFKVQMTCSGCSNAIKRILSKVSSYQSGFGGLFCSGFGFSSFFCRRVFFAIALQLH